MALPQKVIDQLGREPPKTPGWSSQLLMFSSTVFFITLIIYFGLTYGYRPYLDSQTKHLQDQLQAFSQKIPVDKQTELIQFHSQLANLKTILAAHNAVPPLFDWLEKNTEVNIYFTRANFTAATSQLSLSGVAKTMDDIDQQLVVFQNAPDIQRFAVSTVSFVNGAWQFEASVIFKRGFFLMAKNQTP